MTNPANEPPRDADVSSRKPRNERSEGESTTAGRLLQSFNRLPHGVQTTIKTIGFVAALVTVWFLSRVNTPPMPMATVPVTAAEGSQQEYAERLALAKSRREQALVLGSGIESLLKELEQSIGKWAGIQELLRNDDGKLLAGNPQFVSAFSALVDVPRATQEQVNSLRQACRTLIEPVEEAQKSSQSSYLPGDEFVKEAARFRESLLQTIDPFRKDLASIEAMRATARRENKPAPVTLGEAIAREQEKTALHSGQFLADRKAKAQSERDERLAQAEADRLRRITDEEAALLESKAKVEQLRLRAQRADIKEHFRPFLDKGRFRPRPLASPERLEESRPMSYADLKAMGVLNDYKTFARAGAGWWNNRSQTHVIDRQHWPNPDTEEKLDAYRDLFKQFVELAPFWAEDGTLDP